MGIFETDLILKIHMANKLVITANKGDFSEYNKEKQYNDILAIIESFQNSGELLVMEIAIKLNCSI